jgi:hypothetical protein
MDKLSKIGISSVLVGVRRISRVATGVSMILRRQLLLQLLLNMGGQLVLEVTMLRGMVGVRSGLSNYRGVA